MDIPRLGDLTSQVLTSLFSSFLALVPTIAGGALFLTVGIVIGAIFKRAILVLSKTLRVDELTKRYGIAKVEAREMPWSEILAEIVRWSIIIGFLRLASAVWGFNAVRGVDAILSYIPVVTSAAIILIVATIIANLVYQIIYTVSKPFSQNGARVASNVGKWALIVFAAFNVFGLLTGLRGLPAFGQNALAIGMAIAFGFAFGLGGQDAARDLIKNLRDRLRS